MTVDEFGVEVTKWLATARHPRWNRPYTDLTYQPMLEVLQFFRAAGYKTYIATGGGQDFVRAYAEAVYGIPPEQVVGSMGGTTYGYAQDGRPTLTKDPKTASERQLCRQTRGHPRCSSAGGRGQPSATRPAISRCWNTRRAGDGAALMMLVHHDDAAREYAYGPDTRVGTFSDALAGRGQEERLDRDQHEKRLASHFCV